MCEVCKQPSDKIEYLLCVICHNKHCGKEIYYPDCMYCSGNRGYWKYN